MERAYNGYFKMNFTSFYIGFESSTLKTTIHMKLITTLQAEKKGILHVTDFEWKMDQVALKQLIVVPFSVCDG